MKVLILLALFCAFAIFAVQQNAFAEGAIDCDDPHCYVYVETNPTSAMEGVQYKLDTPDLYVDRNACDNIAVLSAFATLTIISISDCGMSSGISILLPLKKINGGLKTEYS